MGFCSTGPLSRTRFNLGSTFDIIELSRARFGGESPVEDTNPVALKLYEIVLPIFQFLSLEAFFTMEFLTLDTCTELLQVFSYCSSLEDTWDSLAISVLSQMVKNCPADFLDNENFATLVMELCLAYFQKVFQRNAASCSENLSWEDTSFGAAKTLISRLEPERQLKSILAFLLNGYKYIGGASTESSFSKANVSDSKTDNNLALSYPQLPEKANESVLLDTTGDIDDLSGISSSLHIEAVSNSETDNKLALYDQKLSEKGNESIPLSIYGEVKDFSGNLSALQIEAISDLETDDNLSLSDLQLSEKAYESVLLNISDEVNDLPEDSSPLHVEAVNSSKNLKETEEITSEKSNVEEKER